MEPVITALLYLQLIAGPGEYPRSEIDCIVDANRAAVNSVQTDTKLMLKLEKQYKDEVKLIFILDPDQDM